MHSNLPSAQSDESNTGDDEPIRIPPESEDLWAQLPEIDTEDDDINAYVPPWLKNLTEEQKAERAMVEDLSRQKTEVKRRRVAPTFENQEQDQEYKPRYNKYRCGRTSSPDFVGSACRFKFPGSLPCVLHGWQGRCVELHRTVEDKARNRLNKWEMIFARGRWGSVSVFSSHLLHRTCLTRRPANPPLKTWQLAVDASNTAAMLLQPVHCATGSLLIVPDVRPLICMTRMSCQNCGESVCHSKSTYYDQLSRADPRSSVGIQF